MAEERSTRYQIEVACVQKMRNVLLVGLVACLSLSGYVAVIVPTLVAQSSRWMAQTETRLDAATREVGTMQVQLAAMSVEVRTITQSMHELRSAVQEQSAMIWRGVVGVLGLLITAVFGLVGVLWNLRSGWLKVKSE